MFADGWAYILGTIPAASSKVHSLPREARGARRSLTGKTRSATVPRLIFVSILQYMPELDWSSLVLRVYQVALAQLEQHRSDNYRSKLKVAICIWNDGFCIKNDEFCIQNDGFDTNSQATLLMKDYKLTAKRPLKKELKFMGLMAQRDRTVLHFW